MAKIAKLLHQHAGVEVVVFVSILFGNTWAAPMGGTEKVQVAQVGGTTEAQLVQLGGTNGR